MSDKEFLLWLVDRLINIYGESENADFVRRLNNIARAEEKNNKPYITEKWGTKAYMRKRFGES